MHCSVLANLAAYLKDPTSAQRFETLSRVVCIAARLDPERWDEYADAVLREAGKQPARQRAEDEKEGA